jgi:hypothetical protein
MAEIIIGFAGKNDDVSNFAYRVLGRILRTDAGSEVGGNAMLTLKTHPPLPAGVDQGLVELVLQPGEGFSAGEFVNWLCGKQEDGTIHVKVQDGYYEFDDRPAIAAAIEKAIKKVEARKAPTTVSQAPSKARRASKGR